jgi:hypothetical protein
MRPLSFQQLVTELKAVGAAPDTIVRTILELREHCADVEAAAVARGSSPAAARRRALGCLGNARTIAAAVAARPELLDWRHRWPQSARCIDSLAWCLALPAAPFVYCATHPAAIVRWGVSSGLAAVITSCILLGVQWLADVAHYLSVVAA